MPYIGKSPTPVPLSASDLNDDIISLAKMAGGTDGNLITYDASGNPVAVATGDDGQILTSAGAGQPCAFEAAAGGGKIGQVVQALKTDGASTTSTSFVTTGLAVAITPTATDSKILLFVNLGSISNRWGGRRTHFLIDGGNCATYIGDAGTGHEVAVAYREHYDQYNNHPASMMYLDAPSTTSEVTYTVHYMEGTGDGNACINTPYLASSDSGNAASTIIAMEVLA